MRLRAVVLIVEIHAFEDRKHEAIRGGMTVGVTLRELLQTDIRFAESSALQSVLDRVALQTPHIAALAVVNAATGTVVAASGINDERSKTFARALTQRVTETEREVVAKDGEFAWSGHPVFAAYDPARGTGLRLVVAVRISVAMMVIRFLDPFLEGASAVLIISGVVALVLFRYIRQRILFPLREISAVAGRFAGGDLAARTVPALRDEVGELMVEFNRMAASIAAADHELRRRSVELARSNADLDRFAYVASHDLQEPLRTVNSFVQLFERKFKGQIDADGQKYMGFIVEAVSRMQALIRDLLTFSRVRAPDDKPGPIDSLPAVRSAIASLRKAIEDSQAVVEVGAMPRVTADPALVTRLFLNLVGNALKFRSERRPEVAIAARRDGGSWVFSVADNGIGIDMRHKDKLFVLFSRLHTRTEFSGTGIGLATCKRIVELQGGSIWVEAELGVGTTFFFTLPAADGGAEPQ